MTSQGFVGFVMDSQGFVIFVMDSRRSRESSRGGGGGSWRRRRRHQLLEADDGAHRGRMRHRRLWRRHHRCHVAQRERARHRALSLRPQLQSRPGRSLEGGERATLAHVRLKERLEQQLRLVRNLEQSRGPRCAIAISRNQSPSVAINLTGATERPVTIRRNQTQSSVTIRRNHRPQSDAIIGHNQTQSSFTIRRNHRTHPEVIRGHSLVIQRSSEVISGPIHTFHQWRDEKSTGRFQSPSSKGSALHSSAYMTTPIAHASAAKVHRGPRITSGAA